MDKKYNIIFLDMDGVLLKLEDVSSKTINKDSIHALNRILKSVDNPKIVISSSWRYNTSPKQMKSYLKSIGVIDIDVIGETPNISLYKRTEEIYSWITKHQNIISNYVVLDDIDINLQNFVHTNGYKGLTDLDANKAIEILTKKI